MSYIISVVSVVVFVILLSSYTMVSKTSEEDRLRMIDSLTLDEAKNILRICALNSSSWSDCYNGMQIIRMDTKQETQL
jgi:hypothetical protein